MLLNRLFAEGLASGPLELETADRVERSGDVERLAEVVELAASALDRGRLLGAAARLALAGPGTAVGGDEKDPDLVGLDGAAVGRVIDPGRRAVTIELALGLDPTLYGRLREQAPREPRIAQALAASAPLTVKVGWFFSRDHATGAPSVLSVRLGEVAFETVGKDRPPFLAELLPELGRRLRVTDPFAAPPELARRLLRAATSPDPAERAGWAKVREVAAGPPFSLPSLELVERGGRTDLCFGPELRSWRRAGRGAVDAVRWLAAAYLDRPDLLVLAEPVPDAVLEWWRARLEAPDAPVEQVVTG